MHNLISYVKLPDEVGEHTIVKGSAIRIFSRFVITPAIARRSDWSGWPNIHLGFADLKTKAIVFFAAGPPWEWPNYRKKDGEQRIAFAFFGVRWYFR